MLIAAALLMFLVGLAHSVLGERYILIRLFKRGKLPALFGGTAFTAGTLRFVWHLLTVAWWGIAFVIWQASQQALNTGDVLRVFSVVALVSGFPPLVLTRAKHVSWIAFFAIAVLLWIAAGRV